MLETTQSKGSMPPSARFTPPDRAVFHIEAGDLGRGFQRRAESPASLASASATARVPPSDTRSPSAACMCAIGAQHRRRAIGVGADILREMIEHLGEALVLDMGTDWCRRPSCPMRRLITSRRVSGVEIGAHVDRVEQILHRLPEEEALGHAVQVFRHRLELAIALAIAAPGREPVPWRRPSPRHSRRDRSGCRSSKKQPHCGSRRRRSRVNRSDRARPRRRSAPARAAR